MTLIQTERDDKLQCFVASRDQEVLPNEQSGRRTAARRFCIVWIYERATSVDRNDDDDDTTLLT